MGTDQSVYRSNKRERERLLIVCIDVGVRLEELGTQGWAVPVEGEMTARGHVDAIGVGQDEGDDEG